MRNPVIFGKYLLLERINVGGMAEVFIAKAFGVEGFEKVLAVKKILPTMAADQEFITMFIDEARISVQLNHANVVHIHELGKHDESYYIAMEYVSGPDLRTTLDRFRAGNARMPIAQAAYIAGKICEGLDYAHRKKDGRGEELHIIHRDVSPQNVLISYEGEVKIIDFGIAKAANRSHHTQAGILKGKFAYMSPEQVQGKPIDRRSDIFAVGNILFEMLTGDRLFVGGSDYSVVEKVRNAEVPSVRDIDPEIPEGLERILYKALAKETSDRYQWASEMQEDLLRFQLVGETIYSSKNLAVFMKEAFEEDYTREQTRQRRYASVARPQAMADVQSNAVGIAPKVAPSLAPPPSKSLQASPSTTLRPPARRPSLPAQPARVDSPAAAPEALGAPPADTAVKAPPSERRLVERGEKVVIGQGQARFVDEQTAQKPAYAKGSDAPPGPGHVFSSQISSASDLVRSDVNMPTAPTINGSASSNGIATATEIAGASAVATAVGTEALSGIQTVSNVPGAVNGIESGLMETVVPTAVPVGDAVPPTVADAAKPPVTDPLVDESTPALGFPPATDELDALAKSPNANLPSLPEIPSITHIASSPTRPNTAAANALMEAAADEGATDSVIGKAVDVMFGEAPAVTAPPSALQPDPVPVEVDEADYEEEEPEIGPDEKTQAREVPNWELLMDNPPAKKSSPSRLSTDPGAARALASAKHNPTPVEGWDEGSELHRTKLRSGDDEEEAPEWPSLEGRGETVVAPMPTAPPAKRKGRLAAELRAKGANRTRAEAPGHVESMITSLPSIAGETRSPFQTALSLMTGLKADVLLRQPPAILYGGLAAATVLFLGLLWALFFSGPTTAQVLVRILPKEASVQIDGRSVDNHSVVKLTHGWHELVATSVGYRMRKERFVVTEKPPVLGYQLTTEEPVRPAPPEPTPDPKQPPPGQNAAGTPQPPTGAPAPPSQSPQPPTAGQKTFNAVFESSEPDVEIRVAGQVIGRTPGAKMERLEVGKEYGYVASKPGFRRNNGVIHGEGDKDTVMVPVVMQKLAQRDRSDFQAPPPPPPPPPPSSRGGAKGTLACTSQPHGAQIFVDGVAIGRNTPAPPTQPIPLPVGKHRITFKLNGKIEERTVDIKAGDMSILKVDIK